MYVHAMNPHGVETTGRGEFRFLDLDPVVRALAHRSGIGGAASGTGRVPHPEAKPTVARHPFLIGILAVGFGALVARADDLAIEADWRKQDGIGTVREPASFAAAAALVMQRGDALRRELQSNGVDLGGWMAEWETLRSEMENASPSDGHDPLSEDRWRRAHQLRRRLAFLNPLAQVGSLLFIKQAPGTFSHQLTQVYGRYARPGGGVFVLENPGASFRLRPLTADLGPGSFQTPDVSWEADEILFAFCTTDETQPDPRFYHLYRMNADGTGLRQLTEGPFDDFRPRFLPDGRIVFTSTRRGGFHRCGSPGCPVYTLAVMNGEGGGLQRLSHHEIQEWDPVVLPDGRILYTRWDYVDRHAVFGQQLWTTWPDGTLPVIHYGNYTRNPVGLWEAQPVPGTTLTMATAAAHHAMTAGSIVLVDTDKGQDGLAPLTRLTPATPFPESESPVSGRWFAPSPDAAPADSEENRRWPGHCYRSPWPLSPKFFLAAYSFDPLVGEPGANPANMFGLYLVDVIGNKELLYRDPEIGSLWPVPLRPRPRPPALAPRAPESPPREGTFIVQNVNAAGARWPAGTIRELRVVQVLPKSTPGKDNPPVGAAAGSPGKAVLGTVPVEADGSAHFTAPAGVPLLFQALDASGQAVQIMRSATYLQPGETVTCIGCHEPHHHAPPLASSLQALARAPSRLSPGPEGSKPFSYPLLVQGILDRQCVQCHGPARAEGGIKLTGEADGHYTVSYNALVSRVPYSDDSHPLPLSPPGAFGARASSFMKMLHDGHHGVTLSPEEIRRLATWMDVNALFYGTFDPADQRRQQNGQPIQNSLLE
jgi:hypothetical protein